MAKVNVVLKGRYENIELCYMDDYISPMGIGWDFTKANIASYTILDEFNVDKFPGLMPIGVVGVALYGATAKEYLISIEWKDGENSVILLDDEYYKAFVLGMM